MATKIEEARIEFTGDDKKLQQTYDRIRQGSKRAGDDGARGKLALQGGEEVQAGLRMSREGEVDEADDAAVSPTLSDDEPP